MSMSKSPQDTSSTLSLPDDDPLAELAKIVSAGSVFGDEPTGEASISVEPSISANAPPEPLGG